MGLISRFFAKSCEDYLSRGDKLYEAERFFEARGAYEDGLQRVNGDAGREDRVSVFQERIAKANLALAQLNVAEAEYCLSHGDSVKAAEHLELAKTLTDNAELREKADNLQVTLAENAAVTKVGHSHSASCGSCSSSHHELLPTDVCEVPDMSPHDYYDLLIRQLPGDLYSRYAGLGENFACAYIAESRDDHQHALELIEKWQYGSDGDIYWYEKGMILYRTGMISQAENCLRKSAAMNTGNPLPLLGLALLLIDGRRLDEAASLLDGMVSGGILAGQALMLRGEVAAMAGDQEGAIEIFSSLLSTPFSRQAAEKLHAILLNCDRCGDAEAVFKKYLKGCCH